MEYSEKEWARMKDGARIIARSWLHLRGRDRVLIVTHRKSSERVPADEAVFSRKNPDS